MNNYPRNIFLLLIALLVANYSIAQNCGNIGFEGGDFTNWNGSTHSNGNSGGMINGRQTIMSGSGFDPIFPSIPVVSPFGGSYSARLGNSSTGAESESLWFNTVVDPVRPFLCYQYAAILEQPGHGLSQQPYFEVIITTPDVSFACGHYLAVSWPILPGFVIEAYRVWKNWSITSVDLTPYIGQNVSIQFKTADCTEGGHFGYAYVDATCENLQITTNYCPGASAATLTAPEGFRDYNWSNGSTNQSITVNNPIGGDSVSVICRSFMNYCPSTFKYRFPKSAPAVAKFSYNRNCTTGEISFHDSSYIYNPNAQILSRLWNFGDGTTSSIQSPSHTFLNPGTYNVTLQLQTNLSCSDTETISLIIPDTPIMVNTTASSYSGYGVSCYHYSDGFAVAASNNIYLPFTYSWSTIPPQFSDTAKFLHTGTYIVTVTNSLGCSDIDSVTITQPTPLQLNLSIQNISCYGDSTGSITLATSGGTSFYLYHWNQLSSSADSAVTHLTANNYHFRVSDSNGCFLDSNAIIAQPILPFDTNVTITNASCFNSCDGSASIEVVGNTPPYFISWDSLPPQHLIAINNQCHGIHSCVILDSVGCAIHINAEIMSPQKLISNVFTINQSCLSVNDGSSVIVPNTGQSININWFNANYQFLSDSSGICGLMPGIYTAIASDSFCSDTTTIEIFQSNICCPTQSFFHVTEPTCNQTNGSIICDSIIGGSHPYTFEWKENSLVLSNLSELQSISPGSYFFSATDTNNCSVDSVFNFIPTHLDSISLFANKLIMCSGDTSLVCAPVGYQAYHWNTGDSVSCISVLHAGNYYLSLIDDQGCLITSPHIAISVYPLSPVSITVNGDTLISYNSVTYQWYFNDSAIIGATSEMHVANQSGYYTIEVSDTNGCTTSSLPVAINYNALENFTISNFIAITSNPLRNTLEIKFTKPVRENQFLLAAFDATGKLILEIKLTEENSIDVSQWASGLYLLHILDSGKQSISRKIVKL